MPNPARLRCDCFALLAADVFHCGRTGQAVFTSGTCTAPRPTYGGEAGPLSDYAAFVPRACGIFLDEDDLTAARGGPSPLLPGRLPYPIASIRRHVAYSMLNWCPMQAVRAAESVDIEYPSSVSQAGSHAWHADVCAGGGHRPCRQRPRSTRRPAGKSAVLRAVPSGWLPRN